MNEKEKLKRLNKKKKMVLFFYIEGQLKNFIA